MGDVAQTNGTTTSGSPKRQLRSAATIDEVKDAKQGPKDPKVTIMVPGERRPRPSKWGFVCEGWGER